MPGSNNVPGPGTYDIDLTPIKNKEPTWRLGTAKRDDEFQRMKKRSAVEPPPNAYNPDFKQFYSNDPKWGFGSAKRGPLTVGKNDSPSMQKYDIPSKAIEGRA